MENLLWTGDSSVSATSVSLPKINIYYSVHGPSQAIGVSEIENPTALVACEANMHSVATPLERAQVRPAS